MDFRDGQISELRDLYSEGFEMLVHAGQAFFSIPLLQLPENCSPSKVAALFCPTPHSGYESRLFLAEKVRGWSANHQWNGHVWINGREWHAVSWKVPAGLTLAQTLAAHLGAFR